MGPTTVRVVTSARLEFELRRLSGVVAVAVTDDAITLLVESTCDPVALGVVVEAILATRGIERHVQILGGTTPSTPAPHRRLPAMALGSVAGFGLLGAMAAAAALQGTFPLSGHAPHHLPTVAAAPAASSPSTGGKLRVVAGKQPPWATTLPDLLVTTTTTVPVESVHEASVRAVAAAAVAEVEAPVATPPVTITTPPVTTPVTTPPTTTTTAEPVKKTPTTLPVVVVVEPTRVTPPPTVVTTTTTEPTRAGDGDGDDHDGDRDEDHDHVGDGDRHPGRHVGPPHAVPAHGYPWQ